jgi:3-deoxy-D-manno-octulosonate 8-phosphate phosphatase (KDO 8-P phosphatase)
MQLKSRAEKIKMILTDVDGTLTDGTILVFPDGEELKWYNVRDGMGILLAHLVGFKTGFITGKISRPLEIRAEKLRIDELHQGILNKKEILQKIQKKYDLFWEEIAFIGDDLGDLEALQACGLSGAVADAHPRVRQNVHFISQFPGGRGAVREFIDMIFDAQNKWDQVESKINKLAIKE